jgi:hypothetical protein
LTPFDLARAPLFRARLIKAGPHRSDLIFNMHHIFCDGWSFELLRRDFLALYEKICAVQDVDWKPLPVQYKDVVAWKNRRIQNPVLREKAYNYWLHKLQAGFPPLVLPFDNHGREEDHSGNFYRMVIPNPIKLKLKKITETNRTTLFMVLFSIFNRLLAMFSGQDEIVCRIPSAGREHAATIGIVGYFINPIFVKNHVDIKEPFTDLLHRLETRILEAFRHQFYPIELLVEELGLAYLPVTVSFNMLNTAEIHTGTDLENFSSYHKENITDLKFPLSLQISEYKNSIEINWNYRKAILKPQTVELMASQECH